MGALRALRSPIIMLVCSISFANSTSTWMRYLYADPGSCVIVTFALAINPFGSAVLTVPLSNRMYVSLADWRGICALQVHVRGKVDYVVPAVHGEYDACRLSGL